MAVEDELYCFFGVGGLLKRTSEWKSGKMLHMKYQSVSLNSLMWKGIVSIDAYQCMLIVYGD